MKGPLGSPNLVLASSQLLAFNKSASEPLGVLPQMPIALGGKILSIDVMVVQGPLDFNLLLGCDYIYAMKDVVPTLFRVMHFPNDRNIMTIDHLSFTNNCTTFAHTISLSVPNVQVVSPSLQAYYVETRPKKLVVKENEPLVSCSPSMEPVLAIDLVTPTIEALEPSLPPIDPSECYFQDVVLPSDGDLLEAMTSLGIILDDVAMVLSNDHIFGLDYPTIESNPNFPFGPDLTIGRSLEGGINESYDSAIELQIGVPYKFDVLHRCSNSPNDDFLPLDSAIGVDFNLPTKHDLTIYRSLKFGLDGSSLVDSTKVRYTAEDFKVDDTRIQVTINRSIPLNLLHTITVLLFLRYRTLSWIPRCLGIGLPPISL